ncbi:hypothetical protein Tco_0728177 [Tanacetum coccineum]|uniref:Uncharacterized protein n=1 Tax=Tanacetum coccineum TaxID=301880 RepID=A0ABQ4YLH0_9ASTR
MGKANRNKGYNINKLTPHPSLRLEEIPPNSAIPPQPIYYPLTPKQKKKMKEVLDNKYKELEESKPILEVLENYVIYKKKLDEILIGKERLNKKEFSEEDKVEGLIETRGYRSKSKAMGEVKNVRIQIGYQDYVVDLLILDILSIDLCIDDGVIRHTYFPKPRTKSYVEAFEIEGEDDWLGSFEVGRDEDGNKSRKDTLPNPLIAEYERMNKRNTITYSLQPVSNANLKWKDLPSVERHAYCFRDNLEEMIKLDVWSSFVSTLYFEKNVDRNNLMKEKCIWFQLYGHEHILTLPEFVVVLGLFIEDELLYDDESRSVQKILNLRIEHPKMLLVSRGNSMEIELSWGDWKLEFSEIDVECIERFYVDSQ